MTVLDLNNGGVKRKRHPRDDGFRIPIVQPSYFFDGVQPRLQDMIQPTCRTSKNEPIRSTSERTFPVSKPESYLPKGPSSARAEFRAITLVKDGRQRASSIHSSRSSVAGREGTESRDGQSKSSTPTPLSRHFPVTSRSSTTISRPSSSTSLLPAHLRPNAARQEDSLSAERYASSLRLLATWESIALKYADVDPEDDAEIDIATGRIVKGKEKIAEMPDRVIGGMSDEEEAEEFRRKGRSSVKSAKSTMEAPPPEVVVEHVIPPVLPLTLDPKEVDFSDKDELDAWNDDELEIQVEALPPSHTQRSRHQRPWTADDDVDLREFLKAEERRKAIFGEEETAEEAGIEDESRSQVGRALHKEEAMSRRTVHASVPYFSTETSPPVSEASSRRKMNGNLSKTAGSSPRPNSRLTARATVDIEDESSAEDELAEMLETPDRLQDSQLRSRHSAPSHPRNSSPLILDMPEVRNMRPSSPSSASSHLNRQSTEGFSSSGEGDTIPGSNKWRRIRQTPNLDEEELCEQQLWQTSSPDKDKEHEDDFLLEQDAPKSHFPIGRKLDLWQDEGRCTSNKVVEVVIDVPASRFSDSAPAEVEEVSQPSPISTGPRRSSRQSAQGKSYALRKKRNRQPHLPREETARQREDVDADRVYLVPEASPVLPSTDPLLKPESHVSLTMPLMGPPTTLRTGFIDTPQSRSRSPSVVEGTPEPLSPDEEESLDHFGYLPADIQPSTGGLALGDNGAVHQQSRDQSEPIAEKIDISTLDPPLGLPVQVLASPSSYNAFERASVDIDDVRTDIPASALDLACSEGAFDPTLASLAPSQDADDEDILLLGATFEDEEEIIWPEMKPDLAQPMSPPAPSEWPNTSCEMSFRSIKGEKQELTTFTAPFRCSRIIDLTKDDLCDDDEHDELDEW